MQQSSLPQPPQPPPPPRPTSSSAPSPDDRKPKVRRPRLPKAVADLHRQGGASDAAVASTSGGQGPPRGDSSVGRSRARGNELRGFATSANAASEATPKAPLPPRTAPASTSSAQQQQPQRSSDFANRTARVYLDRIVAQNRAAPPSPSTSTLPGSTPTKTPGKYSSVPPPANLDGPRKDGADGRKKGPNSGRNRKKKKKAAAQDGNQAGAVDEFGPLLERIALEAAGNLNMEIELLFNAQQASPTALHIRQTLIDDLTRRFNTDRFWFGHPHTSHTHPLIVEAFGSVRFGLATSTSDVDLCLLDPYHPRGFDEKYLRNEAPRGSLPEIYDMRSVARKLVHWGYTNVLPIPNAGVPIVKFEARFGNEVIQVDLNTNERFGVLNSRLINAYTNLSTFLKPLCVLIKFWARQRDLNDPSGSNGVPTFSSYTLILLVIAYLQSLSVLPNLQDEALIASTGTKRTTFWTRPKVTRGKKSKVFGGTGYDTTFVEVESLKGLWKGKEVEGGLLELAKGFFEYYGTVLEVESVAVGVQSGGTFERERKWSEQVPKGQKPKRGGKEKAKKLNGGEVVSGAREQAPVDSTDATASTDEPLDDTLPSPASTTNVPLPAIADADPSPSTEVEVEDEQPSSDPFPGASRSSTPVTYGEFAEPLPWATQKLVVQDPFLLSRNTAQNAAPLVIDAFREEMRRAAKLLGEGASLAVICSSIKIEPGYQSRSLTSLRREQQGNKDRESIQLYIFQGITETSFTITQTNACDFDCIAGGYYNKRRENPASQDPRLALLDREWLKGKKVLDVGCNAGLVTVEIAQRFGAAKVVGVDIDDNLVNQCRRTVELAWSRQEPLESVHFAAKSLQTRDRPPHERAPSPPPAPTEPPKGDYFPLAFPRMFGYLPTPPKDAVTTYQRVAEEDTKGVLREGKKRVMPTEVVSFPENIKFRPADWPNETIYEDSKGYDVIIAFSVTKWIHLHTLNAGLLQFFTRCFETLLPGGRLILEVQPFSTYAKSAKQFDELKANFVKLRDGEGEDRGWRDEDGDFEKVLLETIGFESVRSLGETGKQGFRRPVVVYTKPGGSWV
ncbi:hypothetical protein MNV49_007329 [Pseudohyphozyma bogoriensis]|nr:hypothetical protein MNV49_007329 [Pseudohyphozyma bogoriensis]